MPKTKTKAEPAPQPKVEPRARYRPTVELLAGREEEARGVIPAGALVKIDPANETTVEAIERDVHLVPTPLLVPFYCTAKKVSDRIAGLMAKVKEEILTGRLNEGKPCGTENQHKQFQFGDFRLKCEMRKNWKLKPDLAEAFLRDRNLWDDACNLVIESGGPELLEFLKKHRKELSAMGLRIREELDEEKLNALVQLKKITLAEFELLLDKKPPTYALKAS